MGCLGYCFDCFRHCFDCLGALWAVHRRVLIVFGVVLVVLGLCLLLWGVDLVVFLLVLRLFVEQIEATCLLLRSLGWEYRLPSRAKLGENTFLRAKLEDTSPSCAKSGRMYCLAPAMRITWGVV